MTSQNILATKFCFINFQVTLLLINVVQYDVQTSIVNITDHIQM